MMTRGLLKSSQPPACTAWITTAISPTTLGGESLLLRKIALPLLALSTTT